ncbi:hypothetical protein QBC46DRAFT_98528 [Diplogelasinospora grovesii]|uniref:Uncharacterized protein n=1 Tax=Diplogelasinospora grovesii TaxID=303347 RepID=A0AAN6NAV3_9PEZI|nr:hypothetical protein QBC46DRAFT_98528 [Diplogelasinospora grovesii]
MSNGNGTSATDIITYIGVPLAVLGVLPILYNTAVTLAALSKIKRMLRHSRLTALTRSDVVNRVIEVELPRYAVTPWDRFSNRAEYWTLSRHPSSIPGGSWTTFNWRTNAIGLKTQRVEYADQLRQPQVEVAFDELVSYLLDLGAVPDPHGWRLLRSTGLWTPVGCALMMSPDGTDKSLTIAPLDDSDGHLSLAVNWSGQWTTRDYSHLPPYWVRLPSPPPPLPAQQPEEEPISAGGSSSVGEDVHGGNGEEGSIQKKSLEKKSLEKKSLDSARQAGEANCRKPITCQISTDGIVTALTQENNAVFQSSVHLDSLYIEHVRVRPGSGKSDGVWFASAATAYGTTSQTVLWNYKIPDDILSFSRRETVPCGVLVLLGVVADESATPEWATKYNNDHGASLDIFARRSRDQREAMQAEARMPPAQREAAARARQQRENEQRMQDMRDKMRTDTQRREQRLMEALQSPRWDTKVVAEHNITYLKNHSVVPPSMSLKDAVGTILHRMVLDGQFTSAICKMLDLWKSWAENGGMRKTDFSTLQDSLPIFAQATLLIAMIKDTSGALQGTLSMDLQECLRLWKKVRLG